MKKIFLTIITLFCLHTTPVLALRPWDNVTYHAQAAPVDPGRLLVYGLGLSTATLACIATALITDKAITVLPAAAVAVLVCFCAKRRH